MGETLYMAVTSDEFEFPMFITSSADKLAEWAGIKKKTVYEHISKKKNKPPRPTGGNHTGYRLRKVYIEEDTK